MPVSNKTVLPASGLASNARQASGMRLCSSGASHLAHIARGALPNIAPPSSFWLLPSMDQSFIAVASVIACRHGNAAGFDWRSEEHTSELQSLMRISYAVFCLKKKKNH